MSQNLDVFQQEVYTILFLLYIEMTQVHWLVVKINCARMHFCNNNLNSFMK